MTTAINNAYINMLLAVATYVDLSDQDGVLPESTIKGSLADRLTQPLADFITQNFTVKTQEIAPGNSFSAVVWKGKESSTYTYTGRT